MPQDTGIGVVNSAAAFAREKGWTASSAWGRQRDRHGEGDLHPAYGGGGLENFEGIQLLTRPQTPHIVIPTTAGTGSEVTCMAVILDERKGQKMLIVEYFNAPRIAILDPKMTERLPPLLTASTGMDAMTHAVEAPQSLSREPIADGLAMQAIRLLHRDLPVCTENGADLAARGQTQLAATMAGWAFGNAMVGLVHAMAHSSARSPVCRTGLPTVSSSRTSWRSTGTMRREGYAMVAEALGGARKRMDEREAAEAAITAIRSFLERIGHPLRLSEVGVTDEDIAKSAALSLSDGAIVNNPRPVVDEEEVIAVYRAAF